MGIKRPTQTELINVHQVTGERDVIYFLKNSEKDFVEGLFYQAKHTGQASFRYKDDRYLINRNKDYSFTIQVDPDQDITSESLA